MVVTFPITGSIDQIEHFSRVRSNVIVKTEHFRKLKTINLSYERQDKYLMMSLEVLITLHQKFCVSVMDQKLISGVQVL